MKFRKGELKEFLEEKYALYNKPQFIEVDPVSIPHRFSKKQDIEIAGFLAAAIAWGQRPVILRNANSLLQLMDNAPHEFIVNFKKPDLNPFKTFTHRTFNGGDMIFFLKALQKIYAEHESLEDLFRENHSKARVLSGSRTEEDQSNADYRDAIVEWRRFFFTLPHQSRTEKHFANPDKGSAAKRINMFLRWMIRSDTYGVDFGIWKMDTSLLTCPLDVHSGRVARKLGLLKRNANDWQTAVELTRNLKEFDPIDPVKYDFALFGLGVFEKF
jgi:uncharacterized protein (TIGR02757 family)